MTVKRVLLAAITKLQTESHINVRLPYYAHDCNVSFVMKEKNIYAVTANKF